MTSNVTDRSVMRKKFAGLLEDALVGSGKPVKVVYDYQVGDFRGESPVIVVTSTGTARGSSTVTGVTEFFLEVHTFILYAAKPMITVDSPDAGVDVTIALEDTSIYQVGNTVVIEDGTNSDIAIITDIDPNVSVTIDVLVHSFVTPKIYIWTESQSEDLLDLLEKGISDVIKDSSEEDLFFYVMNTDRSEIDVVEIGGDAYRHETVPVTVAVMDV